MNTDDKVETKFNRSKPVRSLVLNDINNTDLLKMISFMSKSYGKPDETYFDVWLDLISTCESGKIQVKYAVHDIEVLDRAVLDLMSSNQDILSDVTYTGGANFYKALYDNQDRLKDCTNYGEIWDLVGSIEFSPEKPEYWEEYERGEYKPRALSFKTNEPTPEKVKEAGTLPNKAINFFNEAIGKTTQAEENSERSKSVTSEHLFNSVFKDTKAKEPEVESVIKEEKATEIISDNSHKTDNTYSEPKTLRSIRRQCIKHDIVWILPIKNNNLGQSFKAKDKKILIKLFGNKGEPNNRAKIISKCDYFDSTMNEEVDQRFVGQEFNNITEAVNFLVNRDLVSGTPGKAYEHWLENFNAYIISVYDGRIYKLKRCITDASCYNKHIAGYDFYSEYLCYRSDNLKRPKEWEERQKQLYEAWENGTYEDLLKSEETIEDTDEPENSSTEIIQEIVDTKDMETPEIPVTPEIEDAETVNELDSAEIAESNIEESTDMDIERAETSEILAILMKKLHKDNEDRARKVIEGAKSEQIGELIKTQAELVNKLDELIEAVKEEKIVDKLTDDIIEAAITQDVWDKIDKASEGSRKFFAGSRETFNNCMNALNIKKALIIDGVPGTGKTVLMNELAHHICDGNSDRCVKVTFSEETSRAEFIGGLTASDNGWVWIEGVFTRICREACKNWFKAKEAGIEPDKFVVAIDEINRGKTEAIFGEVMTCIEIRNKRIYVDSAHSIVVPDNLYIIATMNTADRGIKPLDMATQQRFAVEHIYPVWEPTYFNNYIKCEDTETKEVLISGYEALCKTMNHINEQLGLINKALMVGTRPISCDVKTANDLKGLIKTQLIPYVTSIMAKAKQDSKVHISRLEAIVTKLGE